MLSDLSSLTAAAALPAVAAPKKTKPTKPPRATTTTTTTRPNSPCATFDTGYVDNQVMSNTFTVNGYAFQGTGLFINQTAGNLGLQFTTSGLVVELPIDSSLVTLRIGAFSKTIDVIGTDSNRNVVSRATVNNVGSSYQDIVLNDPTAKMRQLRFSGGGNEGILVTICATKG